MQEQEIYSALATIFREVFDEDIALSPTLSADDVDDWDSLTHVRLMLTVEKAFKVRFSNSELNSLKNVGDLVRLIEKRAAGQPT